MAHSIRKPAIAGSWYPASPSVLTRDIGNYMRQANLESLDADIAGLIVPHAGYMYSGAVAGHAYQLIRERTYETVVLIGPSHRAAFPGVSIYASGGYETPLGVVPVHERLAKRMLEVSPILSDGPATHVHEHALEIQLPFLQIALKDLSFVPLMMGDQSPEACHELARALHLACKEDKVLMVASSDLSHFHSARVAEKMDKQLLNHIESNDTETLLDKLADGVIEACGGGPMVVAMLACAALGATNIRVLNYRHSGEITGDNDSVVGYAAAVCYR